MEHNKPKTIKDAHKYLKEYKKPEFGDEYLIKLNNFVSNFVTFENDCQKKLNELYDEYDSLNLNDLLFEERSDDIFRQRSIFYNIGVDTG